MRKRQQHNTAPPIMAPMKSGDCEPPLSFELPPSLVKMAGLGVGNIEGATVGVKEIDGS
jgi:hypothetical protein